VLACARSLDGNARTSAALSTLYADLHKELLMRRATPLGHEHQENPSTNQPPTQSVGSDDQQQYPRPFSVLRGGAPAEQRSPSSERHRRHTPVRALIQPSDPERLRRALEAMREMNKLTRQRTEEMRKLSTLSRELSTQMKEFGSVIGGLRIGPERRSMG
jgi:hypothetical protein